MALEGITYFPLEVHLDDNFKLIEAEFGLKGFAVVVKLYQKIYGELGYYCEWTNDVELLFSQSVGEGRSFVSEIVSAAIRRGLFDDDLFKKYSILTSRGIQKRYFEIVSRRKQVIIKKEYLLLKVDLIPKNVNILDENVCTSSENVNNFKQSKVKERKVKESKVKERKDVPAAAAVFAAYEKYIGLVTPSVLEGVEYYISEQNVEPELIIRLIEYACEQGKRSWQYINRAIIGNLNDGILTLDAYSRNQAERAENRKSQSKTTRFNNYDDDNAGDYEELEKEVLDMMLNDE